MKSLSTKQQYFFGTFSVALVSVICFSAQAYVGYKITALVLLFVVSVNAMFLDILPVLIVALISAFVWDFFFIPPVFTLHINQPEDIFMFLMYFIIAMVSAVLNYKTRQWQKIAQQKEEKENAIKLYNTLLNSLSHELRTPIATILGTVDTLKENKEKLSAENQTTLLSEIDTASIRLNRQVENLLNMSRLESGMLKPKADWCDVNELINSVVQKTTAINGHKIMFQSDEKLPLFKLDAGLLEQIIHNLLHNAIQYTPENTAIKIEVSHQQNNCLLVVSDNGHGFPENEIQNVFDKFYRLPHTKAGGSGLGLSIVKGFIEAQGGAIELKNSLQGGAIFTIKIPAGTSYITNLKNE